MAPKGRVAGMRQQVEQNFSLALVDGYPGFGLHGAQADASLDNMAYKSHSRLTLNG